MNAPTLSKGKENSKQIRGFFKPPRGGKQQPTYRVSILRTCGEERNGTGWGMGVGMIMQNSENQVISRYSSRTKRIFKRHAEDMNNTSEK
jgi:hypothetical protein